VVARTEHVDAAHGRGCRSVMLAEPLQWMASSTVGAQEGKLSCPMCSSRVGAFSWHGLPCDCGAWMVPAFQLQKAKIDLEASPLPS
jgi:dual specificity phosphatase 12